MLFPSRKLAELPPAPPALGSPRVLGHLTRMRDDPLELFMEATRLEAEVVRLRFGTFYVYGLVGPEAIEHALVKHPDLFLKGTRGQQLMKGVLGLSMLTADGPDWKRRRRLAQPTFRKGALAGFAASMVDCTQDLVDSWEGVRDSGQPIDMAEAMMGLTLRIACDCLFGTDLGDRAVTVHDALTEILGGFLSLVTAPYPFPDKVPLPSARRHQAAIRRLNMVVDEIIAERRTRDDSGSDLLGMLMDGRDDDGQPLTDIELRAEVVTMLLAGHETTANALTWTLGLLSRHPDVARRVQAELNTVIGEGPAGVEHVRALPYTTAVLKESMRLYPPAWMVSRSVSEDQTVAGYHVPAGSFVFACTYAVQRHPKLWDNPEGFDPDRWLDGRTDARHKLAWMPFGAGQRKCIGEHFAMMEGTLVLATLMRQVQPELLPGHRVELDASITLRPAGGMQMRIRDQAQTEAEANR